MLFKLRELMYWTSAAEINGKWVPARPLNYKHIGWWERLKHAWLVFQGKADAVVWPEGQ